MNLYFSQIAKTLGAVDPSPINQLYDLLSINYETNDPRGDVFVFGNGGSAAVASHFCTDYSKGVTEDSGGGAVGVCYNLASNVPLITAIANDLGYDNVFAKQLEYLNAQGIVIAISSSGNSPNIIEGLAYANEQGCHTVAIVGFDGGIVNRESLADIIIHIPADNYGVVEDVSQIIIHDITQRLRLLYAADKERIRL